MRFSRNPLGGWCHTVERDVEQQDVDPRFAEEAELTAGDMLIDERADLCAVDPARLCNARATCRKALAGEMSGSSPDAELVTMSAGDRALHGAVLLDDIVHCARQ